MPEVTAKDIESAFRRWRLTLPRKSIGPQDLDELVNPFLSENIISRSPFSEGWLKTIRQYLQLPLAKVAHKAGMTRAGLSAIEASEASGSISLNTLRKVAEALDCELIFALRPKARVSFSTLLWQKILPEVLRHNQVKSNPAGQKVRALVGIARLKMANAEFRKRMGFSKQKNQ
jgi:transcriptional regulator with XRE-family HTH domain